jgi:hypothetical protein
LGPPIKGQQKTYHLNILRVKDGKIDRRNIEFCEKVLQKLKPRPEIEQTNNASCLGEQSRQWRNSSG